MNANIVIVFVLLALGIANAAIRTPDVPHTMHQDYKATLFASHFDGPEADRGGYPIGLAGHPDGSLYVANSHMNTLCKMDTSVGGTEAQTKIGELQGVVHPSGMKFSTDGRLFVASQIGGTVTEHEYTGPNIGAIIGTCHTGTDRNTDLQIDPLSGDIFFSTLRYGYRLYRITSMN